MYTVYCIIYNIHIVHCMKFTLYSVQCIGYRAFNRVIFVWCTLYNVHWTLYTVSHILYYVELHFVQCTLYINLGVWCITRFTLHHCTKTTCIRVHMVFAHPLIPSAIYSYTLHRPCTQYFTPLHPFTHPPPYTPHTTPPYTTTPITPLPLHSPHS